MWRRTLVYLGLVEEPEEHDDQDVSDPDLAELPREPARRETVPGRADPMNVRQLRAEERPGHVRRLSGALVRIGVVRAVSFDQAAEQVGERYRNSQPVLMDVSDVDAKTGRRLLDFVSGMIYGLRGRIAPAGDRAFLLIPEGVDLPVEERRRLEELGYRSSEI